MAVIENTAVIPDVPADFHVLEIEDVEVVEGTKYGEPDVPETRIKMTLRVRTPGAPNECFIGVDECRSSVRKPPWAPSCGGARSRADRSRLRHRRLDRAPLPAHDDAQRAGLAHLGAGNRSAGERGRASRNRRSKRQMHHWRRLPRRPWSLPRKVRLCPTIPNSATGSPAPRASPAPLRGGQRHRARRHRRTRLLVGNDEGRRWRRSGSRRRSDACRPWCCRNTPPPASTAPSEIRPDTPRVRNATARNGPLKYEVPAGSRPMIDVHPRTAAILGDPSVLLLVGEGIRKGDSAVSRRLSLPEFVWRLRLARCQSPTAATHPGGLRRYRARSSPHSASSSILTVHTTRRCTRAPRGCERR